MIHHAMVYTSMIHRTQVGSSFQRPGLAALYSVPIALVILLVVMGAACKSPTAVDGSSDVAASLGQPGPGGHPDPASVGNTKEEIYRQFLLKVLKKRDKRNPRGELTAQVVLTDYYNASQVSGMLSNYDLTLTMLIYKLGDVRGSANVSPDQALDDSYVASLVDSRKLEIEHGMPERTKEYFHQQIEKHGFALYAVRVRGCAATLSKLAENEASMVRFVQLVEPPIYPMAFEPIETLD